jgi:hypothetical protein
MMMTSELQPNAMLSMMPHHRRGHMSLMHQLHHMVLVHQAMEPWLLNQTSICRPTPYVHNSLRVTQLAFP